MAERTPNGPSRGVKPAAGIAPPRPPDDPEVLEQVAEQAREAVRAEPPDASPRDVLSAAPAKRVEDELDHTGLDEPTPDDRSPVVPAEPEFDDRPRA